MTNCGEELELVACEHDKEAHFPGLDVCNHTSIQHGDHQGWLVNGKLLCKTGDSDILVECCLDWEAEAECQIVQLLDGHVHSSDCGHEQILHGDHMDYLVDGRLHHVVTQPSCCGQECLGYLSEASVVDHGGVSVLKHRHVHQATTEKFETYSTDEEIVTSIYAAGICCPSELPIINKVLGQINGVNKIDVAVMTKTVKVTHFPSKVSPAVLVAALNDAGLKASLGARSQGTVSAPQRPPWTVLGSGFLLILSLLALCGNGLENLKYVAICATVIGSPFIMLRAWAALKRFLLDINVLILIAVGGAIGLGEYYESAAIVFLFGLAEWLEDRCMGRAQAAVGMLTDLQPEFAIDATTGVTIPVDEVKVNHIIIIRPGDRVPVDCVVVCGDSTVDESMLTGESRPVLKQGGSELKSGTINSGKGSLKARATATVQSSTMAQVALLVDEATMQKSKTEKFVEKFAKIYTPAVVLVAAAVAIIPPTMGKDPKEWVYLSLLLLVTACPCALVISTPVVTVCGITRAAKKSILIKGGQYLEELARVKAITFDKTGTLTEGRFVVTSVVCSHGSTEEEILSMAAAIEVHSTHPLGPAIAGYAAAKNYSNWGEVTGMEIVHGQGIIGFVGRKRIGCGNAALMNSLCPESPLPTIPKNGFSTICYISRESSVIGAISVTDKVRAEAKEAIMQLTDMGIVSTMLTGDRVSTGETIASHVGIEPAHVHAQLLPRDKLDLVQSYRGQYGHVAHIGDGINDAPALASADIGIAMGVGGSALAVEAADIALFSNNLKNLPEAIKISKLVRSKLVQNVSFAIIVKVVVLIFAFLGKGALWVAVLADVGSSLLVVLNGLMILGSLSGGGDVACKHGCVATNAEMAAGQPCNLSRHECPGQATPVNKSCCSSKTGCTEQGTFAKKPCCSSKRGGVDQMVHVREPCCSNRHESTEQEIVEKTSYTPRMNQCSENGALTKKSCCLSKHPNEPSSVIPSFVQAKECCSHGHGHGQCSSSSTAGPTAPSSPKVVLLKKCCSSERVPSANVAPAPTGNCSQTLASQKVTDPAPKCQGIKTDHHCCKPFHEDP